MLHLLFEGFILGLTLAILIGPAFFALVQTSIHRGFNSGVYLAFGIFMSDLALVFLSYLGASQLVSDPKNSVYVGSAGGLMLIGFGIYTFRHKVHVTQEGDVVVKKPGLITYILKGFFLNIANPSVWFYWVFWVGIITTRIAAEPKITNPMEAAIFFFSATLLTVFGTDILKCFISHSIKNYLNDNVLKWINRCVGILLLIFGFYLIYKTFHLNVILLKFITDTFS